MSYGWDPNLGENMTFGFTPATDAPRLHITFGDIAAAPVESRVVPLEGVAWRIATIDGWREPAEDATASVAAPSGDGVLTLYPRMGPRSIVISSNVLSAPSESFRVQQLIDRMSRQRRAVLVVNEGEAGLVRECDVRLLDVKVTWRRTNWAEVTLSLQADDPLRYGSGVLALKNGRNVLLNPGDTRAWPILEVKGPTSKLTIVDSAGTFTLPAVPSGQSRIVDGRNGEVWNGNNRVFDATGLWPRVLVGGTEWTVSGIGSGSVLVRRFQAWT